MSITTVDLSSEEVLRIVNIQESHFADLKAIDIAPGKLTRTIAALSNSEGGEVFIGVDENKVTAKKKRLWRGFGDLEAANGHLQIFEEFFPSAMATHTHF